MRLAAWIGILLLLPGLVVGGQNGGERGTDISARVVFAAPPLAKERTTPSKHASDGHRTVLWLTSVEALQAQTAQPGSFTMTQRDKQFSPGLMVVPVGSLVSFPNADPFFHNVFSLFNGRRFDLGLYQSGQTRAVAFNRVGVSYIFCNIHPQMSAVILSLKTPYFAIANGAGEGTMHNVPPGTYLLEIWSEGATPETLQALSHAVAVGNKSSSLGTIVIQTSSSGLENHLNKFGVPYQAPGNDLIY